MSRVRAALWVFAWPVRLVRRAAVTVSDVEADDAMFFLGWLMVVGGLWRESVDRALVVGGGLLIAAVVFGVVVGVLKKA